MGVARVSARVGFLFVEVLAFPRFSVGERILGGFAKSEAKRSFSWIY